MTPTPTPIFATSSDDPPASWRTYGQIAACVREAMRALGVEASRTDDVKALVDMALRPSGSALDAWCVAALIVPDCRVLGAVPGEEVTP